MKGGATGEARKKIPEPSLGLHGGVSAAGFGYCGVWPASQPQEQDYSDKDGENAGCLGVGHAEERARIDPDDLYQEACNSCQNQVQGKQLAGEFWIAHPPGANLPEQRANGAPDEEFVERRWVNAIAGGNDTIGKTHSPGKISGPPIIAISREEAANAADGVTDGSGGSASVEELPEGQLRAPTEKYHGAEPAEKSAEPSETIACEDQPNRIGEEFHGRFKQVVKLGADNAGDAGQGNHAEGVGLHGAAGEIRLKDVGRRDEAEGDHKAKGGNVERAQV